MTYYYSLRIYAPDEKYQIVDDILGVKSSHEHGWILEVIEGENDEPVFFIDYFLNILSGKYEQLDKIGITREDISIWMLYEYDEQCNMEFTPDEMYKLGKEKISLCISCWQK